MVSHDNIAVIFVFLLGIVCSVVPSEASSSLRARIVVLKRPGYAEIREKNANSKLLISKTVFKANIKVHHGELLSKVLQRNVTAGDVKLHTYSEILNGFSAVLSDSETAALRDHPDVLFVANDGRVKVSTTHSYSFLGLDKPKVGSWSKTTGTDAIVGIIDSGIWPESLSFSDKGFGPVPSKFKGVCQGPNFRCNRKLIGGRIFGKGYAISQGYSSFQKMVSECGDYSSPRDSLGHGTLTASIAAGSPVSSVSVNGVPMGTPKGVAYGARISVYKSIWCFGGGAESDVASAVDKAVADGVDVLSLSLGGGPEFPGNFTSNPLYYFTYKAALAGVPSVFAGGNNGPSWYTVEDSAPWVLTVAAGSIDRTFSSSVVLSSGASFHGYSAANPGTPSASSKTLHPMITGEDGAIDQSSSGRDTAQSCLEGSLDPKRVKGRIVVCEGDDSSAIAAAQVVAKAGGVGAVIYLMDNLHPYLTADVFATPAVLLARPAGLKLKAIVGQHRAVKGYLTRTKLVTGAADVQAPGIAVFSSVGPNGGSRSILKPDISAPGLNIFGAFTQAKGNNAWTVQSGTSIACPHVAGAIALIKTVHPKWTPSMIFSALMTSAYKLTNKLQPITHNGNTASPFALGAGYLNPNGALNPGLVYAVGKDNYKDFLCSPGSGISSLDSMFKKSEYCRSGRLTRAIDVNLPSVTFYQSKVGKKVSVIRTLQNVGSAASYFVSVAHPTGYVLSVSPKKLTFAVGQKLSYNVSFTPYKKTAAVPGALRTLSGSDVVTISGDDYWSFGTITWSNNKGHKLRINVVVNVV